MRKITLIISYSLLVLSYSVKAQTITTIAGIGTGGYSGDGFAATSAELNEATSVAIDKVGNIYIADAVNNRIRRVDASTGIITTIAGTGTAGYNGDGIAATAAELYQPWGVTFDTSGNIYIGDLYNYRVRKITISTGIISTVAGIGTLGYSGDGGLATSAMISYPAGLYVDKKGNLYFGDVDNQRVRKVNTAGYISTVAGTGTAGYNGDGIAATAAELHNPNTVRLDTAGNLYIADYYNNEIRKVDVSTGMISSVAGNGTLGFSGDGGPATSAELHYPTSVCIDAKGNIYLADLLNQRIREVDASTGIITTVAGNGTAGYSGDGGPATSAEFNGPWDVLVTTNAFYIGEQIGNRVRKVTLPSTAGIEEVANGINITIYPNPVSDNLYVHIEGTNGKINFTLFNSLGQQVLQKNSDEKNTTISVAGISSGIYFLKVLTQDGSILMQKVSIIQ